MPRIGSNVLANVAGLGFTAVGQLIFLPVYLRLLGPEAFGLIGFFAAMTGLLQILDMGLSVTVNRELARHASRPAGLDEARDLIRTIEVGYWPVGIFFGLVIILAANWIGEWWFEAATLDRKVITDAVRLMGIMFVMQWPATLYHGGLMGLEKQRQYNAIKVVAVGGMHIGGVAALLVIDRSIQALFVVHAVAYLLQTVCLRWMLWRALGTGKVRARVRIETLSRVRDFALGTTVLAVSGALLLQADRIVLSRMLPLTAFGYYALASVGASGLFIISNAFYYAALPRLAVLADSGKVDSAGRFYVATVRALAVLLFPAACTIAWFAPDIMRAWTGSITAADTAAPVLRFLAIGVALHGLVDLVTSLQLAYGWPSIGVRLNLLSLAILLPGLVYTADRFGAAGAAAFWACLKAGQLLAGAMYTHQRVLRGYGLAWAAAIVLPAVAAVAATVSVRQLIGVRESRAGDIGAILTALGIAVAAAALTRPLARAVGNRLVERFGPRVTSAQGVRP
jgi:O-antigen/teichoic acid export membrane protein